MKKEIRSYFSHSKKERSSATWIIGIAVLAASAPFIYAAVFSNKITDPKYENEIANLELQTTVADTSDFARAPYERQYNEEYNKYSKNNKNYKNNYTKEEENLSASLFSFDPNTVSAEELASLGLKPSAVNRFINYRNSGAKFYKPDDFRRVYGISPELQNRLVPFIKIEKISDYSNAPKEEPKRATTSPTTYSVVNLNEADTTALIALPGIGSKLANRIILFRNNLGGFHSAEQLKEVYGLQDSVYQRLKPLLSADAGFVKKISINTATIDQLKTHPYIKFNLAKVIVAYRHQHGKFNSENDLKKVVAITDDALTKVLPYLSFE